MTQAQKEKLVEIAKSLIGKPYKYGAKPEEAPHFFDCSSFSQYIFKQINIELPRSSILQAADAKGIEIIPEHDFSNLEIGDLIFARSDRGYYYDELFSGRQIYIGHVGIYLGDEKIISARQITGGVVEENLKELTKNPYYRIVFVKRF